MSDNIPEARNSDVPARGFFDAAHWHLVFASLAFVAGVYIEHQRAGTGVLASMHHNGDCPTKDLLTEALTGVREGLTQPQLLARLKRINADLGYPVSDPDLLENLSQLQFP